MEIFFEDKNKQELANRNNEEEKKDNKEPANKEGNKEGNKEPANKDNKEAAGGKKDDNKEVKKDGDNKYQNDDLAEGKEKELNEKLDSGENNVKQHEKTFEKNIEYDMRVGKRDLNMKIEDKKEMELMRRWQIKIYNIYIIPLTEKMDPFVQFTLGGDFQVEVYTNKKGDVIKVPKGKRGFADKTEIQDTVDKLQKRAFDKVIDIEMRMSYSMLSKQKIMIELWDYNSIWMNTIRSYTTIEMMSIVNGNCNISVDMTQRIVGRKRPIPYAIIEFKCQFQEIWDFKLSFLNWKSTSVVSPNQAKHPELYGNKYPNTKVEIELITNKLVNSNAKVISEVAINQE